MPSSKAKVLAKLESLEADQINLGLYNTSVSADHIFEGAGVDLPSPQEVLNVLHELVNDGEVIEWRDGFFRSRIAETVRCIRLLRRRFWENPTIADAPLLVEDVRVAFRQRQRPRRDAVEVSAALPAELPSKVAQAFQAAIAPITAFSGFQTRALQDVFHTAYLDNRDDRAFIISGDTGAGKTEAFLFPILLTIASESPADQSIPGVRAVLVYPRIRLARNQLRRILRYTSNFEANGGSRITVGIQNGEVPRDVNDIKQRWPQSHDDIYRVALLEGCVQGQCEGHYEVSLQDARIENACPDLVCSRCGHRITNLYITQRALENNAPHLLVITDVSLSQWLAREKYSHLWGLWAGDIVTLPPKFLVLDEVHLHEQIKGANIARLIKRFQARVRLAWNQWGRAQVRPMIIGVSATLRDEGRFLAKLLDVDYESDSKARGRIVVIKPSQEELIPTEGRERYIFLYPRSLSPTASSANYRVDDQTAAIQTVMAAMHNLKTGIEWRGLAFFDSINDLRQFQYNYDSDANGRPENEQAANRRELWRIRTDRRRTRVNSQENRRLQNQCVSECLDLHTQHRLNDCPNFRQGDCWIFAKLYGWNEQLRVASSVYAGARAGELGRTDLIPTSPSLEVGYDDEKIQLVYQHKAPRSTASFVQRRGRAGRDPDDSPVIVTLLWPYRTDDAFYFYHPEALYDPIFDDIPLNAGNFNVQRSHALLAFFDLLACLRRQNIDGIRSQTNIIDFTQAGSAWISPSTDVVPEFKWEDKPKRRLRIKHRDVKHPIYFSGKQLDHVRTESNRQLYVKGWLALPNELSLEILRSAWESLREPFEAYLRLAQIVTRPFETHRTYPFLRPTGASLPKVLGQFGVSDWHLLRENDKSNWVSSFKQIDWMLQGNDEVTTIIVQYPNPSYVPGGEQRRWEVVDVTFGLTEMLPGNVSYRLRREEEIHWTPIPRDGESTFMYPERWVTDENEDGHWELDEQYLPEKGDIAAKPDSVFGVSHYLDTNFPGLPIMTIKRLRTLSFGRPDDQFSEWLYDPQTERTYRPQNPRGASGLQGLQVSRRSSARAESVIVPYFSANRHPSFRHFEAPLSNLFSEIAGYLEDGSAMLGYTRVFYEMQIDIRLRNAAQQPQQLIRRRFYPPEPLMERDEAGTAKPILVGYTVDTHGIAFQVNPTILSRTIEAILDDAELRLYLRAKFAVYSVAQHSVELNVSFIKNLVDDTLIAVDYWIQQVVPTSAGQPRLLDLRLDTDNLVAFFAANRIVRAGEVTLFRQRLTPQYFETINEALQLAFQDTPEFRDYLRSVLLHSLTSLLKQLIAQLGGVNQNDLVAYTDLPLMDQVDRTIDPRILVMDAVTGGSGGVAQAFERLNLTKEPGSLWWMLQTYLGNCPIADGEGLTQAVLRNTTHQTIEELQALQLENAAEAKEKLDLLLEQLNLNRATSEAKAVLGRRIFSNPIQLRSLTINPTLIANELATFQHDYQQRFVGKVPHEAVVCQISHQSDLSNWPEIARLNSALMQIGVANDELRHELSHQLLNIHKEACEDGCPVCLGSNSDIEHYYLVELLNSRRALRKLRDILTEGAEEGSSLSELGRSLQENKIGNVFAVPGMLGNRLDESLGFGVINLVDETGQIEKTSVIPVDGDAIKDFLIDGNWDERWNKDEFKPYETPGGIRVRSRAEYVIAVTLEANGIPFEYEPKLAYREGTQTRFIHPDFYLFEHGLYIEYWGVDKAEKAYIEAREFKEGIYRQLSRQRGLKVLSLEADDIKYKVFWEKIKAQINL